MKKITKIFISILTIIILVSIWFYSKKSIELSTVADNNNGIKFLPHYKDSCYVFVPYTLKIYNNRLEILKLSKSIDTEFLEDSSDKTLIYDFKGNEITDYRKSDYTTGLDYYYKIYDRIIFPFCHKNLTFYKAFIISNSEIINFDSKLNFDRYRFNLENLKNTLDYQITDAKKKSLYNQKTTKIVFQINSQNDEPKYFIDFYLNNNQKIYDLKKMSEKELKEFMFKDLRK